MEELLQVSLHLKKLILILIKERLIKQLNNTVDKLIDKLNQKSEEELDTIFIPHPLLGKITLRELYYFTIYHILHHHKKIEENLTKSQ